MSERTEVWQGTLALMVLTTLDRVGALHGYGVSRQIEHTSRGMLVVNYGTLYPALLKLEQQGFVRAEWRQSENNRRAKYYAITRAGQRHLAAETKQWRQTSRIIDWFLTATPEAG